MNLTKSAIKNFCISIFLTAALTLVMLWLKVPLMVNNILIFSCLATVLGVAGILVIRNPQNYTGFYFGAISSVCLGIQFFLMKKFDLTFLYFFVFIPFQIAGLLNWKKESMIDNKTAVLKPEFLPFNKQFVFFGIFVLITAVDYVFASFCLQDFKNLLFFDSFFIKTTSSVMISASILSNYLMVSKKTDAWLYWLLYSISAVALALIIKNSFNLLLFGFFLVINASGFISWLKIKNRHC
ncbi:MAG: nicotinamide riboside transporter PnuC [Prevotellaceae bacterium]|jgi:nicotinamide mononucleotide transporter PnuC|nr:nicotinamide riboside transporter PnuC [Prevotellaceae bacterium]